MGEFEAVEREIEIAIYERANSDSGFAIAYALIQCAGALNRIYEGLSSVVVTLDQDAKL